MITPQSIISGAKVQGDNPFKIFKETEKLLYNYENKKKVLEESYVSPISIPLAKKNAKTREGKIREVLDIEPLSQPLRIQK